MDKRALSALPRPKVKKQYQELRQMISGMKGIVTAERIEIGGEDTLVINCFKPKGKTVIPWFRTFCQETEYISQDLTEKKQGGGQRHLIISQDFIYPTRVG